MAICLECGDTHRRKGTFCETKCSRSYNTRRASRGAELYDLFMALRHDRKLATALKLYGACCRLYTIWRKEDKTKRGGRKSWNDPRKILAEKPYLSTHVKNL